MKEKHKPRPMSSLRRWLYIALGVATASLIALLVILTLIPHRTVFDPIAVDPEGGLFVRAFLHDDGQQWDYGGAQFGRALPDAPYTRDVDYQAAIAACPSGTFAGCRYQHIPPDWTRVTGESIRWGADESVRWNYVQSATYQTPDGTQEQICLYVNSGKGIGVHEVALADPAQCDGTDDSIYDLFPSEDS